MRFVKLVVLTVLSCSLLCGSARADDDLSGNWKIESGMKNGEKVDKGNLEPVSIEVAKDKITLTNSKQNMKFVMSFKAKDGKVEMTIDEGPEGAKGMKAKGIYELKDDTLKLCYTIQGDAPTKFESKADSNAFLFTMKKEKKKP